MKLKDFSRFGIGDKVRVVSPYRSIDNLHMSYVKSSEGEIGHIIDNDEWYGRDWIVSFGKYHESYFNKELEKVVK